MFALIVGHASVIFHGNYIRKMNRKHEPIVQIDLCLQVLNLFDKLLRLPHLVGVEVDEGAQRFHICSHPPLIHANE